MKKEIKKFIQASLPNYPRNDEFDATAILTINKFYSYLFEFIQDDSRLEEFGRLLHNIYNDTYRVLYLYNFLDTTNKAVLDYLLTMEYYEQIIIMNNNLEQYLS